MCTISDGIQLHSNYFDTKAQNLLVTTLRDVVTHAPLYTPVMPRTGQAMRVKMTNCGTLGWVTDKQRGYRYQDHHPTTHQAWPAIPDILLDLWRDVAHYPFLPQACLINFYDESAKMGLHQDSDEENFNAPVVSVSLGDSCLFRFGGTTRKGPTQSLRLNSGDVLVFGGPARLCFHGVDRIYSGSSPLLSQGGRLNLTMRRVTRAP